MEKNKIPTARELASGKAEAERMIEFAKLHVKAALEAAAEKGVIKKTDLMPDAKRYIDKDSILNAYPETLIK